MSRDGFVDVRLPFIGCCSARHPTFDYRALFRRPANLDWHVHFHVEGEDLPKILPALEASAVKIVVDHLGRPNPKSGVKGEGSRALLRSIDKGRTWVKLSGSGRRPFTPGSCCVSPVPSGWYGQATAPSSAMRANSPIAPPSIG